MSCVCNFMLCFGRVCFGFFSSKCHCHARIWRLHFKVRILQSVPTVHFMLSLEYASYSHASCPFFYVYTWLYYFVCLFARLSQDTYSVFLLYSVPLSLRAADVANGNTNGGRNNILSSTVSRPVPPLTSPSPGCAAGDQGKENLSVLYFKLR